MILYRRELHVIVMSCNLFSLQVQDEFRQLEGQPADASLATVIASLHEHIRVFIERLKDSCNVEESIEILQVSNKSYQTDLSHLLDT